MKEESSYERGKKEESNSKRILSLHETISFLNLVRIVVCILNDNCLADCQNCARNREIEASTFAFDQLAETREIYIDIKVSKKQKERL